MSHCDECGSALVSDGACPVCLLQLGVSGSEKDDGIPSEFQTELPSVAELDAQFPQLQIDRLVGRGGMGAVYHARQTNLERDVALKVIATNVAKDPAFAERFEREAKTLARLSHPNIVTVYDYGRTESGLAYLVMEYIDGINLREAIVSRSAGPEDALEIIATICQALQYAHGRGVVHRDIKPENILLGEDGSIKVADFGIAKIVDNSVRTPTLTATKQVLGSLHYLAPEHLEAPEQVDHRVDLYALGVIFYELLTGQLPLGRYEPPSVLQPQSNTRIDEIVLKTLQRKPSQRYQTASDLQEAIGTAKLDYLDPVPEAEVVGNESRQSSSAGHVSVPFKTDYDNGLSEAVGMLHSKAGRLKIEFRVNGIFSKSPTHVMELSPDDLSRVEYSESWIGGKIVLIANSIEVFGELPNAETGKVSFQIKNADKAFAAKLVDHFCAARPEIRGVSVLKSKTEPAGVAFRENWIVYGILMMFSAIVNSGFLAVMEYIFNVEFRGGTEVVAMTVIAAVLLGPVILLQFLTGLASLLFLRPVSLAKASCALSLLPLGPAWLVSCPTSVWAWRWLKVNADQPVVSTANTDENESKRSWGATTMMFIRENRWGRTMAILNVVGAVLLVVGLSVLSFEIYPVELKYRVVDKNAPDVLNAVYRRLHSISDARVAVDGVSSHRQVEGDPPAVFRGYIDGNIVVTCRKRDKDKVRKLLAVEGPIELAWIVSPNETSSELPESDTYDVAKGVELSKSLLSSAGLGKVVHVDGKIALQQDMFTKVSNRSWDLELVLSNVGKEQLVECRPEVESKVLALIVDGVVVGTADVESISGREIEFDMPSGSALSEDSIIAAARGPIIESDLEYLPD